MGFRGPVESQILEAMAAGVFDGLAGAGKPLDLDEAGGGNDWAAFRVLRNNGLLPDWLMQGRAIERALGRLADVDREHEAACALPRPGPEAEASRREAIARERARYAALAHEIRAMQERFNREAPGVRSQRPEIWVEYHLGRLDRRAGDAG